MEISLLATLQREPDWQEPPAQAQKIARLDLHCGEKSGPCRNLCARAYTLSAMPSNQSVHQLRARQRLSGSKCDRTVSTKSLENATSFPAGFCRHKIRQKHFIQIARNKIQIGRAHV